MKNRAGLSGVFVVLSLWACTSERERHITPAFYHWQTTLALTPAERAYLDSLHCRKLYVKMLDVGRDPVTGEIQPYSRLEIADTSGLSALEVIPAVFLTNSVFQDISAEKTEWLAEKVASSLLGSGFLSRPQRPAHPLREVQFDCDWTASTRNAFFLFLKKVKTRLPQGVSLSATIRLHQYKFPERTGVPPVDRGILMFYNTGDLGNPDEANSIFQPEDADKYLSGAPKNYRLPLDLALPVFSWVLVYREGEFWKIIPDVPEGAFADSTRFEKIPVPDPRSVGYPASSAKKSSSFLIRKGTFLAGHYLRPDDLLRLETVPPDLLVEAARQAARADLASDATVSFFHLDTALFRQYPVQLLDSVCQMVRFPEEKK